MKFKPILFIIVPVILAVFTNAIIYKLGWDRNNLETKSPILPPGWVIGMNWTIIFGILGFAIYKSVQIKDYIVAALLIFLIALCIAYPFYTSGLEADRAARIGNTSTLIIAFVVSLVISVRAKRVLPYMVPILLWGSYVNISDALYA